MLHVFIFMYKASHTRSCLKRKKKEKKRKKEEEEAEGEEKRERKKSPVNYFYSSVA